VGVLRRRESQRLLQLHLPRRALQQVRAAYDVSDTLIRIVYDHGELICKRTITPANDGIA
jgi:hypothetical protein